MNQTVIRKWNWNNGSDFSNWINEEITHEVLAEFWCWYQDLQKTILHLSDNQEVVLAEIGELSFDGLPLPTLDTKFCICGKEFEIRDALSLATHDVWYVAKDFPDSPDGWRTPNVACTDGVRDYALGFFCGVIRGMLN